MNEPLVWISLGVSPVNVEFINPETLLVLERHLQINPRVKAIGPIGFPDGRDAFVDKNEHSYNNRIWAAKLSGLATRAHKWNKPICLSSYGWATRRMILVYSTY